MAAQIAKNGHVGFVTSVLSCLDGYEASSGLYSGGLDNSIDERILLISNLRKPLNKDLSDRKKKRSRTSNRKRVSLSETITHAGTEYPIHNAPSYGVYLQLLHKIIAQLEICIVKWRRVFVIRFDLHQKWHTTNSKMITRFRKNLSQRIARAYGVYEVGYAWVREQERAKQQHYHFVLFLDGDKVNHSATVSETIRDTWEGVKVGNSVHIPKRCFYNVVDDVTKAEVIYRVSYLAKQRGKGYRADQAKDYGTSRLIVPSCYNFNTGEKVT